MRKMLLRRSLGGKALVLGALLGLAIPGSAYANTVGVTVKTPGATMGPGSPFSEISTNAACSSGLISGGGINQAIGTGTSSNGNKVNGTSPSPDGSTGSTGVVGTDVTYWLGIGGNGARGGNGGGGGGGGYFGGGGGSGGGNPGNLYGAGGGGGSSFAAPTATDVSLLPAVNQGNGKAIVSFRYGASVTVAADTAAPLFGHPVTLTATVGSVNPSAGTPGGTVTFPNGATELATVPLDGSGRARFRTGTLQPGSHPITARYGGDPGHTPGATANRPPSPSDSASRASPLRAREPSPCPPVRRSASPPAAARRDRSRYGPAGPWPCRTPGSPGRCPPKALWPSPSAGRASPDRSASREAPATC
ncbi:Ig-like domain repeat protein [Streptomyces sp. ISL-44]|uniref:Ig-like domain-containing protein n=1 Tax=Streptomyces sp. ISL-44 TaxID=2819184 RepID=UPI001BE6FA5B|nr:Ig-like domain repeat protein [Streptomyces sp. ISL-44]MBT2545204.1 Ig-like domain repeat protein [Streptomyces sp. ISL-44]